MQNHNMHSENCEFHFAKSQCTIETYTFSGCKCSQALRMLSCMCICCTIHFLFFKKQRQQFLPFQMKRSYDNINALSAHSLTQKGPTTYRTLAYQICRVCVSVSLHIFYVHSFCCYYCRCCALFDLLMLLLFSNGAADNDAAAVGGGRSGDGVFIPHYSLMNA